MSRATLSAMTALPLQPHRLLTVAEFAALPENGDINAPAVTGVFTAEEPFPVRLELDELLRPPGQR